MTLSGDNFNEPLIDPTQYPLGSIEVVTTINGASAHTTATLANGVLTFLTPPNTATVTYGATATFAVYFKTLNSRVAVAGPSTLPTFSYGPVLYPGGLGGAGPYNVSTYQPISPNQGHRGGGDRVTLYGCGFSYFTRTQLDTTILFNGASRPFCFRGPAAGTPGDSLQIYGNGSPEFDRIECVTNAFDCTSGTNDRTRPVSLVVNTQLGSYSPSIGSFATGPQVTQISPTSGAFNGGDTISITGQFFFSSVNSKGWSPRVRFASLISGGAVVTRNANLVSDTLITVVTPSNFRWGEQVAIDVDFVSTSGGLVLCGQVPRTNKPTFTFGPSCTAVSPAGGPLSGSNIVTVTGNGFVRGRTTPTTTTVVQVCIQRLNPMLGASGCAIWEPVNTTAASGFLLSDTSISFQIPNIRKSVLTAVGGNRLFGDVANILLSFSDVAGNQVAPGVAGNYLNCGTYLFGPRVSSVTPNAGANGPQLSLSPVQPLVIGGTNFVDPLYENRVRVDIGTVGTVSPTNDIGATPPVITADTIWGGVVGTSNDVIVTFDTCNSTVSSTTISWGPKILSLIGPSTVAPQAVDVWGLLPAGGQSVTVVGTDFSEFSVVRCIVDGAVGAPLTGAAITDTQIVCTTPSRLFGTVAEVSLQFGVIPNFSSLTRIDWRATITAAAKLHYTPRITSFTPNIGLTSGNTQVTISGEGFAGWPTYLCYFGYYTNGVVATASSDGTTVTCATPTQRGEFNTDVPVDVLLSSDPSQLSWKVLAPNTFHYGPVCTAVLPTLGHLGGNELITLQGVGFQDCVFTNATQPIIRNCTFNNFRVNYYDPTTGKLVGQYGVNSSLSVGFTSTQYQVYSPAATYCQQNLAVQIEYLDPIVTHDSQRFIQCVASNATAYSYGPKFVSQSSQYYRNGISYGWTGMAVTFTGVNFHDPAVWTSDANIQCLFGNQTGTLVAPTTDTSITCTAPNGTFNELETIYLVWTGGKLSCTGPTAITAGKFHWGPVIDAITPVRGYVAGNTPVTISGFAFDCCGITSVRCLFPDQNPIAASTTSTAVCNVPANIFVDRLIVNIGLSFSSPLFSTFNASQTLTEAQTVLTYYYGPLITSIAPTNVRLSGLQPITISGVGFADPYFTGTFCDYYAQVQGAPLPSTPTFTSTPTTATDSQIVCPVQQYAHACGAIDQFELRWARNCSFLCGLRSSFGPAYLKSQAPPAPPNVAVYPYYSDGGTDVPISTTITYGPTIVSVTSSSNPSLVFPTAGGGTVTITGDSFGDWVAGTPSKDFGSETALCTFGFRRSATPSAINAQTNTIVCTVPPGGFGASAPVGIILDPHANQYTTIGSGFTWQAYATSLNKYWTVSGADEVIIVKGAGFFSGGYFSVVCVFGDDTNGRVQSHSSIIVDDYTVECVAPVRSAGVMSVELYFCTDPFLRCSYTSNVAKVVASNSFTYVGITGLSPDLLPACSAPTVTLTGFGFSNFDSFICLLGGEDTIATLVSDTTIVCSAPNSPPLANLYKSVSCNNIELQAAINSKVYDIETSLLLEYAIPDIVAIYPNTSDISSLTQVTIVARHLQGSDTHGTYHCRFGPYVVNAQVVTQTIQVGDELLPQQVLVCVPPTLATQPALTVGTVPFEVQFNCFDSRGNAVYTSSNLQFTFTRTFTITLTSSPCR